MTEKPALQGAETPLNLPVKTFKLAASPADFSTALRGKWGAEAIDKYIGGFRNSCFAYAASDRIRKNAASGGTITAILTFLMASGKIDGALVCRSKIMEGKVRPEFYIAENAEDLWAAQGSKYIAVDFIRDALPLIRKFPGKLAVVALPCDTTRLRHTCEKEPVLKAKIMLLISLFCGHNSQPELSDMVVRKLTPAGATLADFRYRQGHWRGSLRAVFDDEQSVERPFSFFSDYQNLYYFCQQKCRHCCDHTGYDSDIAVGDIWSRRMKANPIKHNAVIIRTERGDAAFQQAVEAGVLIAHPEPIEALCKGQARSLPFHYNISARAKAGRLLGIKIKDSLNERVRWNEFLVALIMLFNDNLSRSAIGQKMIYNTPRFMLKFFLYLMKGLESI